ncbi:MAG: helicase [Flavobacteriales bacterium]|nr:MAG: helicase [Flavobacteriales bacterium]
MTQEKALAILKSGKNVFLTGSAGTGKTHVLNQYINYLRERKVPVAVTASTGIAATHMNGMTIHSWSGIGIKEQLNQAALVSLKTKKYLKKNLENVKVLIIDEISMLHKKQLDLVNTVLQFFKENNDAFGGIQVVFSGDFFQLPPIGNNEETSRDKFAFMSDAWLQANLVVCYLTEQFRQANNSLNKILNELRNRTFTKSSYQLLLNAKSNTLNNNEEQTQLFTHNIDVDSINSKQLEALPGKKRTFRASTKGNKKLVETLKKSVLTSEVLTLKINAKVMFVKNNVEKGFVNGTLGTVTGFDSEGLPKVKLRNGKIITVEKENWDIQDERNKILASLKQIPLRLAWAITVHKSQGMTLEEATIDLSKTFERGQGYVALSRLKSLESMQLLGINNTALAVDALAYKADQRFMELSDEANKAFSMNELAKAEKPFIKACGGITNEKEIKKVKNKLKDKKIKTKKGGTHEITMAYLIQKKSIAEIAEIRGLTEGTIASHLIKIREKHPKVNLTHYRPKKEMLKKVRKAYDLQKDKNAISLKKIYDELDGSVTYQDIKLCLAFFN